jgi:hypothetical protein
VKVGRAARVRPLWYAARSTDGGVTLGQTCARQKEDANRFHLRTSMIENYWGIVLEKQKSLDYPAMKEENLPGLEQS